MQRRQCAHEDVIQPFELACLLDGGHVLWLFDDADQRAVARRVGERGRLDEREHRWKFNPGDIGDRKLWNEYQHAYELMLQRCSTAWAPWYVIPSDHKWARNAAVATIVRETLEEMNPQYPKPDWKPKDYVIP